MTDHETIADFAVRYGTTPGALRHYERLGLLDDRHVLRTGSNYRTYTSEAADRVRLISLGRTVGLSLDQMRTWIDDWESGDMSEQDRVAIFADHMVALEAQIEQLASTRAYLISKMNGHEQGADGHGDR